MIRKHVLSLIGLSLALPFADALAQTAPNRVAFRQNTSNAPDSVPEKLPPPEPPVEPLPAPEMEEISPVPFQPGEILGSLRTTSSEFGNVQFPQPDGPLELGEVLRNVERNYPLLIAVAQERGIAAGNQLAAAGAFDTKLAASSMNNPMGFYKTYRHKAGIDVPTWMGGSVNAGYKLGDGNFEPWYGERQTNEGGEFSAGFNTPLWRDRPIDDRRADLRKAELDRQIAEPTIYGKRIAFFQKATVSYWKWVAAGQAYKVYRDMLEIAEERDEALAKRVETGDVAPIERTDNRRVIAQRQGKLIAADRYFQSSAIDLSLFLRDEAGQPVLPGANRLAEFPPISIPNTEDFQADVNLAMQMRPELRTLNLERAQAEVDLQLARNLLRPGLDAMMWAAKDVGAEASPKGDKTPFQLEAGVMFDVPVQRRKAIGKIRATEAKLAQINAKQRYARDKIVAELQDAYSALVAAYQQWDRAREGHELARQVEQLERRNFELGNSTILIVQLREQATADAALLEVGALFEYFAAEAEYRAVLALPDPEADRP